MTREALLDLLGTVDERSIWGCKQNHPELVVQDATMLFGLDVAQQEQLRRVLMLRGVNKWLLARRRFIDLKHHVKGLVHEFHAMDKPRGLAKRAWRELLRVYEEMQHIAKSPRWVEWGQKVHGKMRENVKEIVVRGHST